jgi:asparaginyl-tRNA synthetase
MTYTDAIVELEKHNASFDYPVHWGSDLQTEHERYLTEQVCKGPVIVTDYPKEIKAFYMKLNDDGKTVRAMDVLVPRLGEIIGGSERESRLEVLTERMGTLGLDPADYWWYLDLRRFGSVPHAGFGLGFDRAIQYITGMQNIRDVIPYPRAANQADF